MSYPSKLEYLKTIFLRYKESNKLKKSQILDEYCEICGITRKHAIRLLKKAPAERRLHFGPRVKYDPAVLISPLRYIWQSMNQSNSKKIKSGLTEWLSYASKCDQSHLFTDDVRALLLKISCSSIERLLKKIRWAERKGKSTTKGNKGFLNRIPIQAKDWNVTAPGTLQADTVAHCGDSLLGSFIYSLTATDLHSGWTENRATWNKGMSGVIAQIATIEQGLPFKIQSFKTDSGTEFMNHMLKDYLENREKPIKMVRSRPYRSNDNCYVEQKNFTHVRELFGYQRLNDPKLVDLMNEIYSEYWNPLQNFFIPSTKLLRKTRIGARIKKEFEPHKTPYQRLIDSDALSNDQKELLRARKQTLNPFELSKVLEQKLRHFFEQVQVTKVKSA
jgi:hypothetical protein